MRDDQKTMLHDLGPGERPIRSGAIGTGSVRLGRRHLLRVAGLLAVPVVAHAQASSPGQGGAEITVDRARTSPIPIAIPVFTGGGGQADQLGRDIAGVITNNLGRCGLFRPIDQAGFVGAASAPDAPNFDNWKAIGAQALVTGRVEGQGGSARVEFRLWDVLPASRSRAPPTPPRSATGVASRTSSAT